MATPTTVSIAHVRRCLKKKLISNSNWPDTVAIAKDSELYSPPAKTPPNDVPVHFGFKQNSGVILRIIEETSKSLFEEKMLKGRRIPFLSREPENLTTYGALERRVQRLFISLVARAIGETVVKKASSKWIDNADELNGEDAPPDWEATGNLKEFLGDLTIGLQERISGIDNTSIDPDIATKIKKAKTLTEIRDILLVDVVKKKIEKRMIDACK